MSSNQNVKIDSETGDSVAGKDEPQWHAMTMEEVFALLGMTQPIRQTGLTSEEVAKRLDQYGENILAEKDKVTLLQRIWRQVNNVLVGIVSEHFA